MKKCVLCGAKTYKTLFEINESRILECQKCGLVKTEGRKDMNYEEYHRDEDYKKFRDQFKNIFEKRFQLVERFKKEPGKILDIGASTGTLLGIFKTAGWEAWGVEPSKSAIEAEKAGIRVSRTIFEKAKLPGSFFDVVILNHTLEHLADPIKVLRKAKTLLKNGGIILVDVPNFGSLSAKILGRWWPYLAPQEHLYHFTPQTLTKVFQKAGLEVIYSETRSGILDYGNPLLELWRSLVGLRKRLLADLFGLPGAFFATMINMGMTLSVVGVKK